MKALAELGTPVETILKHNDGRTVQRRNSELVLRFADGRTRRTYASARITVHFPGDPQQIILGQWKGPALLQAEHWRSGLHLPFADARP